MEEDRVTSGMARYTVAEAADILGITSGAVRNRLSRGTLASVKENRTVYVLLPVDLSRNTERDTERGTGDAPPGMLHPESDALTSELLDRLRYVEGQLEAERQAYAEARRLLAAALERIPAVEAPQEASDAPESVEKGTGGPHSAAREAQDELGAERARREMAETTLHEGMAEERRRREEAERERDDLRRELFALREREEAHEAAEEQQGRGQPQSATGGAQRGARRPWWRRLFRG